MIDPLLEVTPTMALAETFTAFIVQPMEHLGRHIGKFFNALLQETSWLSSPVILSFVFVAILLCLVMIFNYRFRLPFFLGSFEPTTVEANIYTGRALGHYTRQLRLENDPINVISRITI